MGYKIIKDIEVFNSCKDLYKDIFSKYDLNKLKDNDYLVLKRDKDIFTLEGIAWGYSYIKSFFDKVNFDISKICSIVLSNIFDYRDDMSPLYNGGICILDDNKLLSFIPANSSYPHKKDVLVPEDNIIEWLVGKPSKFFVESMKAINNFFNFEEIPNLMRVHMVEGDLILSIYWVSSASKDFLYGSNDKLDSLIENIVKVSKRFSFEVREIYWYVNSSYTKTNGKKHSDGEFTLVIS